MIFGIDVSSYQQGIDMRRARAEGVEFCIAKVTEGTSYRSPAWPAQRDQARAAGMLLAGYHYCRTGNPAGEAAACKAWLGDISIPVMLDWEQGSGNIANLIVTLNAFRTAGLRVVLGYLPRWYWQQTGGGDLRPLGVALVSSRYPSAALGVPAQIYRYVTQDTWSGYGGLNPTILQFTDRATVAGVQVDANAFLGTRDQLATLLGAGAVSHFEPTASIPEDDVAWTDKLPDYYTGDPNDTMFAGDAVAWGTAHAANARDAAREAVSRVVALENKIDGLAARIAASSPVVAAGGPVALTDADVQRIATAVIGLLGHKTSS